MARKAVRKFDEIIPAVVAYMTAHLVAIATPDDGKGGRFEKAWDRADRLFAELDDEQQAHVEIIARGQQRLIQNATSSARHFAGRRSPAKAPVARRPKLSVV